MEKALKDRNPKGLFHFKIVIHLVSFRRQQKQMTSYQIYPHEEYYDK